MEAEGFPNFRVARFGRALLWDIYTPQANPLERFRQHFRLQSLPPTPPEKRQGFWKHFYQPPGGGKHSQTDALNILDRPVFIVSPLLELEKLFVEDLDDEDLGEDDDKNDNDDKDDDKDDDKEDNNNDDEEDYIAQYLPEAMATAARSTQIKRKGRGTLILRAWCGGRFPDDSEDIATFAGFMLASGQFAQETMNDVVPDVMASYHTHLVKSDGVDIGQKRYTLSLAELSAEYAASGRLDDCNIRFNFKAENLKRTNQQNSGVWELKFPRGYDYKSGFCTENGYFPSTLTKMASLQKRCHVQLVLRLGSFYEFRNGQTTVNRGITFDVCSIGA